MILDFRLLVVSIVIASHAPVPVLGAQNSAGRAAKRLTRVFARPASSDAHYEKRWQAIRAASSKLQSRPLLRARVEAFRRLDAEAQPMRARFMTASEPRYIGEYMKLQHAMARVDAMQNALRAQIEATPRSMANDCLDELLALLRFDEAPFSLALLLVRKAQGFSKLDDLRRRLARPQSAAATICLLRLLEGIGKRARVFRDWVLKQVESESDGVRLEALRVCRTCRFEDCVDPLLARLEQERGRLRVEVFETLEALTGKRLERSASARHASRARPASGAASGTAAGVAPEPKPVGGDFFRVAQDGTSVLYILDSSSPYILDSSSSMASALSSKRRVPRMRIAKRELVKSLEGLDAQTRAQVEAYSSEARFWKHDLRSFDRRRLRDVKRWIQKLKAGGSTNTFRALADAFRLAGGRGTDRYDELSLETIYLLSDGHATDSNGGVLAAVRRWNPIGRVRVHTIEMGVPRSCREGARFMTQLARQNAGRSKVID